MNFEYVALIICSLFCFLLRALPRLGKPLLGHDSWFILLMAKELKEGNGYNKVQKYFLLPGENRLVHKPHLQHYPSSIQQDRVLQSRPPEFCLAPRPEALSLVQRMLGDWTCPFVGVYATAMKSDTQRTLLLTGSATLDEMLKKGNVWYVRNYEAYFDRVYVAYLFGPPHEPITQGNTTLLSLASGKGTAIDLLLVPYKLYRLIMKLRPTTCITMDVIYSWWAFKLTRVLSNTTVFLLPVCNPEEIYRSTHRSLSRTFPIFLERVFVRFSFNSAEWILAADIEGSFTEWLIGLPFIQKKLVLARTLVDYLPSKGFFDKLRTMGTSGCRLKSSSDHLVLAYVGRLHAEKLVSDLVRMIAEIKDAGLQVTLNLIGDGPEKCVLQRLAKELGVASMVNFLGVTRNEDLPEYLSRADAFVSPFTGTSLREAALCGLPIIAYDIG